MSSASTINNEGKETGQIGGEEGGMQNFPSKRSQKESHISTQQQTTQTENIHVESSLEQPVAMTDHDIHDQFKTLTSHNDNGNTITEQSIVEKDLSQLNEEKQNLNEKQASNPDNNEEKLKIIPDTSYNIMSENSNNNLKTNEQIHIEGKPTSSVQHEPLTEHINEESQKQSQTLKGSITDDKLQPSIEQTHTDSTDKHSHSQEDVLSTEWSEHIKQFKTETHVENQQNPNNQHLQMDQQENVNPTQEPTEVLPPEPIIEHNNDHSKNQKEHVGESNERLETRDNGMDKGEGMHPSQHPRVQSPIDADSSSSQEHPDSQLPRHDKEVESRGIQIHLQHKSLAVAIIYIIYIYR